jgi:FKBP-type peptidyl-prolyl cis-trans isomerase SlyD
VDTTDPAVTATDIDGINADGPIVIVLREQHVLEPVEDAI